MGLFRSTHARNHANNPSSPRPHRRTDPRAADGSRPPIARGRQRRPLDSFDLGLSFFGSQFFLSDMFRLFRNKQSIL